MINERQCTKCNVWDIKVLHIAGSFYFPRCLLRESLEHWAAKWRNLKGPDGQINFSSMRHSGRYLCQCDFFGQTFD